MEYDVSTDVWRILIREFGDYAILFHVAVEIDHEEEFIQAYMLEEGATPARLNCALLVWRTTRVKVPGSCLIFDMIFRRIIQLTKNET